MRSSNARKNELKMFCAETGDKICEKCLPAHAGHHVVRVCRYMYENVVPVSCLEGHSRVGKIQSYKNNGQFVVYLDRSNQGIAKHAQTSGHWCRCGRSLTERFIYCSILCYLEDVYGPVERARQQIPPDGCNYRALTLARDENVAEITPATPPRLSKSMSGQQDRVVRGGKRKGAPVQSPLLERRKSLIIAREFELMK
mmetsp:Transcript_6344/g.12643  ORF Transcript_6344/g.12643 Transcript_6344/m.12643 type:complete len:198 (-) Transcript_6344:469-1062(-)